MMKIIYPIEGEWTAEIPELPGCVGAGDTPQEALEMVLDAKKAWLAAYGDKKLPEIEVTCYRTSEDNNIEVLIPEEGWWSLSK